MVVFLFSSLQFFLYSFVIHSNGLFHERILGVIITVGVQVTIRKNKLFSTPIANSYARIANIRYWGGQRADKRHSLLADPIANNSSQPLQ